MTGYSSPPPLPAEIDALPPAATIVHERAPELVRQEHLKHENALKALGALHFLGGCFFGFGSIAGLIPVLTGTFEPSEDVPSPVFALGYSALGFLIAAAMIPVGRNLRKLSPKAFTPARLLSALGLFAFPIGTLIHGSALYYLSSEKGRFVLSDAYREIVERTPQVRAKTSPATIVLLILVGLPLLALIFLLIILPFLA